MRPRGRLFSETIQCPYHAWTYATDGRLVGAPHMNEIEGFDKRDYPLHAAAPPVWTAFCSSPSRETRTPRRCMAPVCGRFERFNLPALTRVRRIDYEAKANWKLIFQNYSECLHCPTIHPELSRLMPYTSGANDLVEGPYLGGHMLIAPPNKSMTTSGEACGVPLGKLSAEDMQRAYYYTIFPNLMLSVHPDYVAYYRVWPLAADRSRVSCEWLLHPDSAKHPETNPGGRRGILGRDQPPGLAHQRTQPRGHRLADVCPGPLLATGEHAGGMGPCVSRGHAMSLPARFRPAALALALLLAAGAASAQVVPTSSTSVRVEAPAALEVWNRPIVELRAGIDQVTPADRVSRARKRIEDLPLSAHRDQILATPTTMGALSGLFVSVGGRFVFAILPQDLDPESGLTLAATGDSAVSRLTAALTARADQRRMPLIIRGAVLSLLATQLLVLVLRMVRRVRRRTLERPFTAAVSQKATILGVNLGEALTAIERAISKLTAYSVVIAGVTSGSPSSSGAFPLTQHLGVGPGGLPDPICWTTLRRAAPGRAAGALHGVSDLRPHPHPGAHGGRLLRGRRAQRPDGVMAGPRTPRRRAGGSPTSWGSGSSPPTVPD